MGRDRGVLSAAIASAGAASLDDLHGAAVPHLRDVVNASWASLYRYTQPGQMFIWAEDVARSGYSRELYQQDPSHRFAGRLAPRPRIVHISRAVGEPWRRSPAYHEFYRRRGFEHMVCVWLTREHYGQPGFVGVAFSRNASRGEFSPRELANLRAVLPALSGAVGRGLDAEGTAREHQTLEAILAREGQPPVLAFDLRGRLLWISAQAAAALRPIPDEILGAVCRLGEAARGRLDQLPVLAVSCRTGEHAVRAELSLTRVQSGEPVVVVTLDFAVPDPAAALLAARHGLTAAESRVLAWMLAGLSNRGIAARLAVSVETVRTHSKRALDKLGVASRVQAMALAVRPRPER